MPANDVLAANPEVRQRPPQIASWKHLVGFLLIGARPGGFGPSCPTRSDERQCRSLRWPDWEP
jgi:hypothetical protein